MLLLSLVVRSLIEFSCTTKTNVCHWAVFLLFALPDLSFITTWPFLWKVSAITLVSCLPLYIIKYLKRKFSPPSYSKLSSWAKLGLPCFVVSCFTERSVFSTFFTHWSSVTGQDDLWRKRNTLKNGKLGEIKTIFFGLCHWDLGMTWKKKHIKKKDCKRMEEKSVTRHWLHWEGLEHLTSFCWETVNLPSFAWKHFKQISFKCHFIHFWCIISTFLFLYVEFRLFLSVIFYSRY